MLRRLASALILAICLPLVLGWANEPKAYPHLDAQSSTSIENQTTVSPIPAVPQSADVSHDVDLTGFLAHPLLVTGEPVLILLHLEDLAHQKWQRFGLLDVAPFCFSRSLPILI